MSNLKKNLLVSGCGITYNSSSHKTWTPVLRAVGYNIIDVSGPAVSNQWILNKTLLKLLSVDCKIDAVIIQLTNLGKLDVTVDVARANELVKQDPLRNFIIHPDFRVTKTDEFKDFSVWPSSVSQHHVSKQLWAKWLCSPLLELEDVFCKLVLLSTYCKDKQIPLYVIQGYKLPWQPAQIDIVKSIITNFHSDVYSEYEQSVYYQYHDFNNSNSVPCFQFQIELARQVAQLLGTDHIYEKILTIQQKFSNAQ